MRKVEDIRIAQCVACRKDTRVCGATKEDSKGLCMEYESIFKEGDHDKRRSREKDSESRQ